MVTWSTRIGVAIKVESLYQIKYFRLLQDREQSNADSLSVSFRFRWTPSGPKRL